MASKLDVCVQVAGNRVHFYVLSSLLNTSTGYWFSFAACVLWFKAFSAISDVELIGMSSFVRGNDKEERSILEVIGGIGHICGCINTEKQIVIICSKVKRTIYIGGGRIIMIVTNKCNWGEPEQAPHK